MIVDSQLVEVGGRRIAYRRAGSGPPLVLVHGLLADSRTWGPQLAGLAVDFDVVAWDAPGCGGSDAPAEDVGLPGFADALAGFIDALDLEWPSVCGLSFGGALALQLHLRHPGVASRLISAGGYAGWAGSLSPDEVRRRLERALAIAAGPPERGAREFIELLFSDAAPRALVDSAIAIGAAFHPAGVRAIARAMAAADLHGELVRVSAPTLVIHGEEDRRAPLAVAEGLHAAIPGSRLVVLRGAGHISNLEAPEAFNQVLRDFIGP